MADGGTQYQSKLLDLVYAYLDIELKKSTPGHPEANGESERTVQTVKGMIRAHIDEDQETWNLHLNKYAFAFNSSVHCTISQTPFEMQFGRKQRIPIDIILPNTIKHDFEPILHEFNIQDDNFGEVTVLEDHVDLTKAKIPAVAEKYLNNLKQCMEESFRRATQNRDYRMEKKNLIYNRNIKKFCYEIGDYVLVDHPHLKKGLSRGIARRYYGPFVIKKRKENEIDYYIQRVGSKKGGVYQIHQNRLKA